MKQIKIAIVGAGVWGETHASIYREHANAIPVAITWIPEHVTNKAVKHKKTYKYRLSSLFCLHLTW